MIDAIKVKIANGRDAVMSWVVAMPLEQKVTYVVMGLLLLHIHG